MCKNVVIEDCDCQSEFEKWLAAALELDSLDSWVLIGTGKGTCECGCNAAGGWTVNSSDLEPEELVAVLEQVVEGARRFLDSGGSTS